ncbi:MAG: M48 family metallopeptidase [Armatimonadota bacterium]
MRHVLTGLATAFAIAALLALLAPAPALARIIGRGAEISIGRETASAIEQFLPVDTDPAAVARVRQIGRRLVASSDDPDFPFEFHVVESPEVNAFALPGGFIYVFRGLLQLVPNDDALASVLAHEISHVTRHHSIRQFEKNLLLSAGISAILQGTGASGFRDARAVVQAVAGMHFSRKDETDADEHGIRVLTRAGYNPRAAVEAMELVQRASGGGSGIPALLRSHPLPESRVKRLTELAERHLKERESARAAMPAPPAAPAANAPRLPGLDAIEPEPCAWLPLRPGTRWVYQVGEGKLRIGIRVLEELDSEPRGVFRVEYQLGSGVRSIRLLAPAGDRVYSRPEQTTDAPWRLEGLFTALPAGSTPGLRVAGEETVRVAAGEFPCLRIEHLAADGKVEATSWYARGVGLVKRHSVETGATQELLSYHLANAPQGK